MNQKSISISILVIALVFGGVLVSGCLGDNNNNTSSATTVRIVSRGIYLTPQQLQQLQDLHKKPVKVQKLTQTRQKAPLEAVKIMLAVEIDYDLTGKNYGANPTLMEIPTVMENPQGLILT